MKCIVPLSLILSEMSLPSWERGLKYDDGMRYYRLKESLPSWERGLKLLELQQQAWEYQVAPLVGAWIEITGGKNPVSDLCVAPLVGAWIEILENLSIQINTDVAPLVGAWIEIRIGERTIEVNSLSLPSWERGLKYKMDLDTQP